jgi:hypothetical protein
MVVVPHSSDSGDICSGPRGLTPKGEPLRPLNECAACGEDFASLAAFDLIGPELMPGLGWSFRTTTATGYSPPTEPLGFSVGYIKSRTMTLRLR